MGGIGSLGLQGGKSLLKTFLFGIVLGIVAGAGALYSIPMVDQVRKTSIISVIPNGGNTEVFHINIPMDRIMAGSSGRNDPLPANLEWPEDEFLADTRAELFKLNDANGNIIGVASRVLISEDDVNVVDWVLHLPARGSMYVSMAAAQHETGRRSGRLRAGSREFAPLIGAISERWVVDNSGDEDAPVGRIELTATYVGAAERLE